MIRGHEQIERGFEVFYDLGDHMLLDAVLGGRRATTPTCRSTRRTATVTPMALTHAARRTGTPTATPWPLHYQPFNYEPHNGLYRRSRVLEYRYG